MQRHCLLAILLSILSIGLHAQPINKIDSLLEQLGEAATPLEEGDIYLSLADTYSSSSPDTALIFIDKALAIAQSLADDMLLARTHNTSGNLYWAKSDYERSLQHFLQAKTFFENAGDAGQQGLIGNLKNIGYLYFLTDQNSDFLFYTNQALTQSKALKDTLVMAGCYHNLGVFYESKQVYDQALSNYLNSLRLKQEANLPQTNLANSIDAVAGVYNHMDKYEEALTYYRQALDIRQELGNNKLGVALSYYNIGVVLYLQKNIDEALEVYHKALELSQAVGNRFLASYCYDALGDLKVDQQEYKLAISYIDTSLSIRKDVKNKAPYTHSLLNMSEAQKEAGDIEEALSYAKEFERYEEYASIDDKLEMAKLLSSIYQTKSNYKEAFVHQEAARIISDSILEREKKQELEYVSVQYEKELAQKEHDFLLLGKENQIQTLETQNKNILLGILFVGFIVALIFSLFIYRHNNQRKRANAELAMRNEQLSLANEELNVSNNSLQQFVFAASHGFKEKLRSISVFSQVISSEAERLGNKETRLDDAVNFVVDSVEGMHSTLDNLLQYSQIHNHASEECVEVNIGELVKYLISTIYVDKKVKWVVSPDLPLVKGNKVLFTELFSHLIDNAIQFQSPDRELTIEIGIDKENNKDVFYVADNGRGVDQNYNKYIFAPFNRLAGDQLSGAGLGLAICQNIVDIYQGDIWCVNNIPQGTVMKFTLMKCIKRPHPL